MNRWFKSILIVGGCVVLLGIVGITFTIGWRPFIGPRARALSDRVFERTPERLARGAYLAESVSGCVDCHSPHDWTQHDAPIQAGMKGAGQDFILLKGLPGHLVAPNLTPDRETGAGNWSDDALARGIREGIGHDGRTLFPFMPYPHFRAYSDEDVASLVVYLRSLQPIRNALPVSEIIFPVKYLIRDMPAPLTQTMQSADLSTPLKRGEFLVNVSACSDCHTPQERGQPMAGLGFAGGFILDGPFGRVASANITPDPSGIAYYDEALFVQALRTGMVKARTLNQVMPWTVYRGMTDEDLRAMFAYLKTIKPVKHRVDNTEAPTECKLCNSVHGAGGQN